MVNRYCINYFITNGLIWVLYYYSSTARRLCPWLCLHSLLDAPVAPVAPIACHSLVPHNKYEYKGTNSCHD